MLPDTPIRCVVVDDEPLAADLLVKYIAKTPGLELTLRTTLAGTALERIRLGDVDIVFLDIQMPEMNGVEFMEAVPKDCKVVLTTAYPQYALKGFEYDVIDYLLKPITYKRFTIAVEKMKDRLGVARTAFPGVPDHIFIKTGHLVQKVLLNEVSYIEASRDYIVFHLPRGKILSLESMKNMEEILPQATFLRIHKSYIINKTKIVSFGKWRIAIGGKTLPVGGTYRDNVKKALGRSILPGE